MISLNNLISGVSPSPTLALTARARELKAAGEDVIPFTAGEPDFDTPEHVKAAAREAMEKGHTKYTPVGGINELKDVIIAKYKRELGVDYEAGQVLISNGGKQNLAEAFAVLINPGDEVVIPAPYWTSYPDMVKLVGGEPVIVQTTVDNGYRMTPEQLKSACSEKTKIILINSPSNPTGACYAAEDLKAIAETIKALPNSEDILIISDEVYEYVTFEGFKHTSIVEVAPELIPQTLISSAFSKSYSMTGWRVGFAAGPKEVIAAMTKYQSQTTSNVCSIAQHAATRAFDDNGEFPKSLATNFWKRLNIVQEEVSKMNGLDLPLMPQGAFYAFIRLDGLIGKSNGSTTINSASDFAGHLIDEQKVVVVPGEAFGDAGGFRISIAVDEDTLRKGLGRIAEAANSFS